MMMLIVSLFMYVGYYQLLVVCCMYVMYVMYVMYDMMYECSYLHDMMLKMSTTDDVIPAVVA